MRILEFIFQVPKSAVISSSKRLFKFKDAIAILVLW